MSTYLQSLVNGYAGVRLRPNRLDINPAAELPPGVSSLHLVGLDYLGSQLNVAVMTDEVSVVVMQQLQQQGTAATSSGQRLRLCVFEPEEVHILQLRTEVRYRRRRAAIMSSYTTSECTVAD